MPTQILSTENHAYRFLIPISMLFIITLIASALAIHRTIQIGSFIEPGGILIYPLTYFFSDIIAENYGYKISHQILFYGLIFQFIFSIIMNLLLYIPATPSWHDQTAFEIVFKPLLLYSTMTSFGTLIGGHINIAAISRWKKLVQGRYFWIRSLTSSCIGEAVFTIIALPAIFIGTHNLHETMKIVWDAYLFKLVYGVVAIIPSTILVSIIKKIEGCDFYDHSIQYNPFK